MAKLKRIMGCGCIIGVDYDETLTIVYCPKHKTAPDLYEALKALSLVTRRVSYTQNELAHANEALAKADGK